MLTIKDPADLLEYLKTRREMAAKQNSDLYNDPRTYGNQVYAFDEAIKAVEAMINQTKE